MEDLDKQYNFGDIRDSFSSVFEGYVIREMKCDYIDIVKDDDLPDWDLKKMGISENTVC